MKYITETLHCVDYRDLEEAVSEFHGLPYSVVCALEASNYTDHRVRVSRGVLREWGRDSLEEWKDSGMGGDSPHPAIVMKEMVNAGKIPAGDYVISIRW